MSGSPYSASPYSASPSSLSCSSFRSSSYGSSSYLSPEPADTLPVFETLDYERATHRDFFSEPRKASAYRETSSFSPPEQETSWTSSGTERRRLRPRMAGGVATYRPGLAEEESSFERARMIAGARDSLRHRMGRLEDPASPPLNYPISSGAFTAKQPLDAEVSSRSGTGGRSGRSASNASSFRSSASTGSSSNGSTASSTSSGRLRARDAYSNDNNETDQKLTSRREEGEEEGEEGVPSRGRSREGALQVNQRNSEGGTTRMPPPIVPEPNR